MFHHAGRLSVPRDANHRRWTTEFRRQEEADGFIEQLQQHLVELLTACNAEIILHHPLGQFVTFCIDGRFRRR